MGKEVENKNKDSIFYQDYAGRDMTKNYYITMYADSEREFVSTHNANIKPVSYFTGRDDELAELRNRVEGGQKSVLVSGMGGIGKTHICRKLFQEYVDQHAKGENDSFNHLAYIEYSRNMGTSLVNCLKFKQQENPEQNQEAAWNELEYLASSGKLLLFVDNVNRPAVEDSGLERLCSIPGAVVVTSRSNYFNDEFEPYPIDFLSKEQCKEIYERIRFGESGREVKQDEIGDFYYIIDDLVARHTITIEFIAHLAKKKLWDVKRLRNELEEKGFRLSYHKSRHELVNIQESFEKLYDLSELTPAEQNILEAFSLFPYIPLLAEVCNQWLLKDAGVSEEDDVLNNLYQDGWLQFDEELGSYAMHPVFAKVIYDMRKSRKTEHIDLINKCERCLKISKNGSPLEGQMYVSFAESIVTKVCWENILEKANFEMIIAGFLRCNAEYDRSITWVKRVLAIREMVLGTNHPDVGMTYCNIAILHDFKGNYSEALDWYQKVLDSYKSVLWEDVFISSVYHGMGNLYHSKGEYGKSLEFFELALGIREERMKGEPEIAVTYNCIGLLYKDMGNYDKALEFYNKALAIRENILGKEHISTSTTYNNIAIIYSDQGRYAEALELHKKSLAIKEKVLGRNHPNTAIGYNNVAGIYDAVGKHDKSIEWNLEALEIQVKTYGENHPEIATTYNNLAVAYKNIGDYEKGLECCEKSLKVREQVQGKEHSEIANTYGNRALIYQKLGMYEKALFWHEEAFAIRKKIFPEDHLDIGGSYHDIAGLYVSMKKYDEALEFYNKALTIRKKVLGEDFVDTSNTCYNMAVVCCHKKEYERALELLGKALEIRERILGKEHLKTANVYHLMGNIFCEVRGEYDEAEKWFEKAFTIKRKLLGENQPETIIAYNDIIKAHFLWKGYDKILWRFQRKNKWWKLKKNKTDVCIMKGLNKFKKGNIEEALKIFEGKLGNESKYIKDVLEVMKIIN